MRIQKAIKRVLEPIKADSLGRRAYVWAGLVGERLYHAFAGAPKPSDAIVLAGSGRSGTTWITNLLVSLPGTQQIYEPLFPPWVPEVLKLTGWEPERHSGHCRAFYIDPEADYPEWEDFLKRVLTGKVRNYWTDFQRDAIFPSRYLIKTIRAHLMLGFLSRRLDPKILFLMRHPCAVVHSRLAVPHPWQADVQDLLSQEELVQHYLLDHVHAIEKERDPVGAHAVWWAVENAVALRQLAGRPHYRVHYEEALLDPRRTASRVFEWLGKTDELSETLERVRTRFAEPSRVSRAKGTVDPLDRLSEWKRALTREEQRRILAWAERMGVPYYNDDVSPKKELD